MDLNDLPIFESSDEEDMVSLRRKRKTIRERINYFETLDDDEFVARFRLEKETCLHLLEQIREEISSVSQRNDALTAETKLLLALRLYATGSMLLTVADFSGVSKASACVSIKKVTYAIARLSKNYIKMPVSLEDRQYINEEFYKIAKFPCVVGAIDCTHVRIQSPGGHDAEVYRNRKGYFSWNVQVICDPNLKIRDVVARWPGSSHDQTILSNSRIKARCEVKEFGNGIFLGDNGYANTNYFLTSLHNPVSEAEKLYNESQIRTRNVVERCFGVWKRRFPILSLGIRLSLETSKAIIIATAILHNIAIDQRNILPELENHDEENEIVENENQIEDIQIENNIRRLDLINNHFSNLL